MMYFDGSKCMHGAREGIMLVSPTNQVISIAYKLNFKCTNNMVEYEALILGLKAALELKMIDLTIYGDSQLIVNQVKGSYDTKDKKLRPYRLVVLELLEQLHRYTINTIARTNNRYADAMASVASLVPIELEDEETILTVRNLSSPSYQNHLIMSLLILSLMMMLFKIGILISIAI